MEQKKCLAIIPARGGSKRIPKKNIKDFCGRPIISYSIESARESGLFDEIMVSTDSEEIAHVAQGYGATVPFLRSEHASTDYASVENVILEVVEQYRQMGRTYDIVVGIYPTAPFLKAKNLQDAVDLMINYRPSLVIPVVQFSYPPQRCFVMDENHYIRYKYPEYITTRSQDLQKQYHDAGQFAVYNVEKLIATKGIIEDDMMPVILSELEVQDIDTLEDWKIAELKYKMLENI